jgi:hypothetical protein
MYLDIQPAANRGALLKGSVAMAEKRELVNERQLVALRMRVYQSTMLECA